MQNLPKQPSAPAVSPAAGEVDRVGVEQRRVWRVVYMHQLIGDSSRLLLNDDGQMPLFEETLIHIDAVQKSGASIYYAPGYYKFATRTRDGVKFFDTHAEAYRSENW